MSELGLLRSKLKSGDYDGADIMQAWIAIDELERLRAHVAEVKDLLALAKCPCCDGSGAYYDNHGEVCQCQWCYEKNKPFKSLQSIRREAMEEMKQRMIEWVDDGTEWHDANDVIAAIRNAPIGEDGE